jgi:hypothetical protein
MSEGLLGRVVEQLQARKGQWPTVAMESGVPYKTVVKIGMRTTKSPRIATVEKLSTYFGIDTTPARAA